MLEVNTWNSAATGRQRMIGSRRSVSGRNLCLMGLTGRERLSIIRLQKVLPTMQASITPFCSTCVLAPLCYTTDICFDLGQPPQISQHCQRNIPHFFSYSCKAPENVRAKKSSFKNRLAFLQSCYKGNLF